VGRVGASLPLCCSGHAVRSNINFTTQCTSTSQPHLNPLPTFSSFNKLTDGTQWRAVCVLSRAAMARVRSVAFSRFDMHILDLYTHTHASAHTYVCVTYTNSHARTHAHTRTHTLSHTQCVWLCACVYVHMRVRRHGTDGMVWGSIYRQSWQALFSSSVSLVR